jgi:hypothetical protein
MCDVLVDVAMSYVHASAPHVDDESLLATIREKFVAAIADQAQLNDLATFLEETIGTKQPVDRIAAILQVSEDPPPPPAPEYIGYSLNSPRRRPKPWSSSEDLRLLAALHRFGLDNWGLVAKFVAGGRIRAQCAQRWARGLDPRISKDVWSKEEEDRLRSLMQKDSSRSWTKISAEMGTRSDVQCRYHFMQMQRDGKGDTEATTSDNHQAPLAGSNPRYLTMQQFPKTLWGFGPAQVSRPSPPHRDEFTSGQGGEFRASTVEQKSKADAFDDQSDQIDWSIPPQEDISTPELDNSFTWF